MAYLQINARHAAAFQILAEMLPADFKKLAAVIVGSKTRTIRSSILLAEIERISKNASFSEALHAQLMSLATLQREEKITPREVVDAVRHGLARADRADVSEGICKWFEEVAGAFTDLLGADFVVLPAKARNLSIDFEHIYSTANVVTDVRPIFDDQREAIHGALVIQAVNVHFFDNRDRGGDGQITFALDVNDMRNLISELEVGIRKAEIAKKQFRSTVSENIYIIGEEN